MGGESGEVHFIRRLGAVRRFLRGLNDDVFGRDERDGLAHFDARRVGEAPGGFGRSESDDPYGDEDGDVSGDRSGGGAKRALWFNRLPVNQEIRLW